MRAIALLVVLVIAKVVTLVGHSIPLSGWTPIAYFWQDVLVALIFYALDRLSRRPWIGWTLYALAVTYVAFNVAVSRVLSSPLTLQMMRAAGGALSDSIRHHLRVTNLTAMLVVIGSGALLPVVVGRLRTKRLFPILVAALAIVVLGPTASSRVETIGLHRNALVAIATSSFPRTSVAASSRSNWNWRESPFEAESRSHSLEHLVGSATGRNVVLVLLESAGASYLKTYGAQSDPMPNLTKFAKQAVVFESAYAVYPESIRTLFSVLHGHYPVMKDPPPSIAESLKKAHYRTALFHSGRFMYLGMEDVVRDQGFDVLEDAGEIGGQRESSFGVDEQSTVRRMLSWIDSMPRHDRFFLTYLPIAGHHPYDTPVPGPFPEREESERYLNALHYADSSLNELIEGLRSRGLAERTLFVIAGDHGEAFGQHEGNYGHSLFIYDENVRVPLLIAAPGLTDAELRIRRPVSLIDTAPTILSMLGLHIPGGYHGRSMLNDAHQMALFSTNYSLSLLGLRDGCWKYIYEQGASRSKLFNVCEDPRESRDLSEQHPERVGAYKSSINDWGIRWHPGVEVGMSP